MARRRAVDLTDYTSVARTKGDIAVGAYARQQRRRRILIAAGGVALIGAAVWLYAALQPADAGAHAGKYAVLVKCARCGKVQTAYVKLGEASFPLPCQACGERACQQLWECRDCGKRFVAKGAGETLMCPACGSRNVGAAQPTADETEAGHDGK